MPHVTFLGGNNVTMKGTDPEIRKFIYCPSEDVPFILDVTGITPPNPEYYISRECCDHYILLYVTKGCGTLEYNGIHYDLRQRDAVLIEPGSRHRYYADRKDPFELVWANFFCDFLDDYLSGIGLKGNPVVRDAPCEKQMSEIVAIGMNDPNNDHILFRVMRLVDEILLLLAEKTYFESKKNHSHLSHAIKDLLDECVYGRIDVNGAAEKLHISKSSLYREFTKSFGIGPHQYVLQKKIDLAKTLLRRTNFSVKDIADKLSFSDEFYFSNLFKKKTGISPTAFRKEASAGNIPDNPPPPPVSTIRAIRNKRQAAFARRFFIGFFSFPSHSAPPRLRSKNKFRIYFSVCY